MITHPAVDAMNEIRREFPHATYAEWLRLYAARYGNAETKRIAKAIREEDPQ